MAWQLIIAPRAERDLRSISGRDQQALLDALLRLTSDPGSAHIRKLAGHESRWRLRVGDWRAVLELDNEAGVIHVLRVLPRGTACRR